MVALKLPRCPTFGWPRSVKQERRGGIETAPEERDESLEVLEAGTPWWH